MIFNGSGPDTIVTNEWTLSNFTTIQNLKSLNSPANAFKLATNDEFVFDSITVENAAHNGIFTDGPKPSTAKLNVTNSIFVNNGLHTTSNPADLEIFKFEGNVLIENVTISKAVNFDSDGDNRNNAYGIEFRGNLCNAAPTSSVQSAFLNNVNITGSPNKEGILIQCYSDVSNFSFNDVDLSNVITSPGSFWPSALLVSHNGSNPLDVGNLKTTEIFNANSGGIEARNATFFDSVGGIISSKITTESILTHIFDDSRLGEIVFFDEIIIGDQVDSTEQNLIIEEASTGIVQLPTNVTEIKLSDDTAINLNAGVEPITAVQIIIAIPVTVEQEVTISSSNNEPIEIINEDLTNVVVIIPDDTKIQASNDWDGQILPPKQESFTGTAPTGFTVDDTVIEVGSPDTVLVFDKSVEITLSGVTGTVGYKPSGSNQWIQITNQCGGDFDNPTDPVFPGECFISNGSDTKIVTFHFTSFGGLSATPSTAAVSAASGSSSGGSGKVGVGPSGGKVSMDRVTGWAADSKTFRFAISHLIKDNSIDAAAISPNGKVPAWMLQLGEFWHNDKISDQEFFNSINYLVDQKILK